MLMCIDVIGNRTIILTMKNSKSWPSQTKRL